MCGHRILSHLKTFRNSFDSSIITHHSRYSMTESGRFVGAQTSNYLRNARAFPLLPAALASVSFGFVLIRVRVRVRLRYCDVWGLQWKLGRTTRKVLITERNHSQASSMRFYNYQISTPPGILNCWTAVSEEGCSCGSVQWRRPLVYKQQAYSIKHRKAGNKRVQAGKL